MRILMHVHPFQDFLLLPCILVLRCEGMEPMTSLLGVGMGLVVVICSETTSDGAAIGTQFSIIKRIYRLATPSMSICPSCTNNYRTHQRRHQYVSRLLSSGTHFFSLMKQLSNSEDREGPHPQLVGKVGNRVDTN